jgi:parallel beta-helix repeat protein
MKRANTFAWSASFFVALFVWAGSARAKEISGTITTTLTIMDDSKLVGDVNCTVTGAPCIVLGAPGLTLDLNGFTLTGLADPQTGCSTGGGTTALEDGIEVNAQAGVIIRGPGLVQRFRRFGIRLLNSMGSTVTGVTASTNCLSGIFLNGGSDHVLENNVSVRNGDPNNPCGGI